MSHEQESSPAPADASEWQKMLEEEWLWNLLEQGDLERIEFDERIFNGR